MRAVSIEAPEADVIGRQLHQTIIGRSIDDLDLTDVAGLQRTGFVNRDTMPFHQLKGQTVTDVRWRGGGIIVDLADALHLVIAPEYGGRIRLTSRYEPPLEPHHLALTLDDGSILSIRLTGMGGLQAWPTADLARSFSYTRDFLRALSPLDLEREAFRAAVPGGPRRLKPLLVGNEAVIVGIGNASFQEIAFRAGIRPDRRTPELGDADVDALFDALAGLMAERLAAGGKLGFEDLFGRPGRSEMTMASGLAGRPCSRCGTTIEKKALGGGTVGYCPHCQR
jgi:formamidopyrimidine-DNA glycosylase